MSEVSMTGEPGEPDGSPARPASPDHDASGLELARSIARGLTGKTPRAGRGKRRSARDDRDPSFSGAHPDDRDPQLLDSTIGRLVADRGWQDDVRVHDVVTRWSAIVGHDVGQHAQPESYDAETGRLVVRADSTAWATNLRMMGGTLLATLARELGAGVVRTVEVLGPVGPSWKRGRRSVRDGRGPRDTYG